MRSAENDPGLLAERKRRCRREGMLRRASLGEGREAAEERIRHNLFSLPCYREAMAILSYASYRDEVDTWHLMEGALREGKQVYCPRVVTGADGKREMEFRQIRGRADLEEGYLGIPEPVGTGGKDFPERGSLVIMPGCAFDRDGRRLGYGGGFYDRFLAGHPGLVKVAVCFSCQVLREIPEEETDIRPDLIVTEEGVMGEEPAAGSVWHPSHAEDACDSGKISTKGQTVIFNRID